MARRAVVALTMIAGTLVPAIVASGGASAQLPLPTTTTTTTSTTTTTTTTAPDETTTTTTTTTTTSTTTTSSTTTTTEAAEAQSGSAGLAISVPAARDLATAPVSSSSFSAQLGNVTVTDSRGNLTAAWTATVSATDFTTGEGSTAETIDASSIRYWSGVATTTGIGTFVPGQASAANAQHLGSTRTAYSASVATGDTSATWNPTIVVTVPSGAVRGTYAGTITHSVA